jgi:hypothetical protein
VVVIGDYQKMSQRQWIVSVLVMTEYRDSCTKCNSMKGYKWHWGKNDGKATGYSECLNCGAEYRG